MQDLRFADVAGLIGANDVLVLNDTRVVKARLRGRKDTGGEVEVLVERVIDAYLRRTNRRLYGVPTEQAEFCWATWFLPLLDTDQALARLDAHLLREVRYAATGRRTARALGQVPYASLVDRGFLPLVTAFWAARKGSLAYDALVARRVASP